MNRSKAILPLFIISILISSCVVSNINPAADKDENEAKYVIDRIKKLGLVVIESSLNDVYVLYKEYGGFEIKRKEEFVANPFPNKNIASNWSAIRDFLGVQGDTKSVKNFFKNLNGRLFEYHNSVTEP